MARWQIWHATQPCCLLSQNWRVISFYVINVYTVRRIEIKVPVSPYMDNYVGSVCCNLSVCDYASCAYIVSFLSNSSLPVAVRVKGVSLGTQGTLHIGTGSVCMTYSYHAHT